MHLFSKHKIAFACQFGNISGLFHISCSLNSIKLIFYLQWILLCQLHTLTMKVKSVRTGEYTAPPAHGPMMREIWGMTPEAITFLWKQEHVQCQKYDTSCWWWVYGHDSRHLCGMLNRKEFRASSFWAQKIVRCKTWHFKIDLHEKVCTKIYKWNTRNISAYPARDSTPSWIRAPPESFSPITGAPTVMAWSMIWPQI